MGIIKPFVAVCFAVGILAIPGHAPALADDLSDRANRKTVGLLAAESQWFPHSLSIAAAVQHDNGMRVLPILGSGTLQSLIDLARLDSVDAALITLDTLTYAKAQGLLDGINGKVSYLARLQPVSWALVAPKSVASVDALSGKRIATGPTGSAGFVAGELFFNASDVSFSRVPKQGSDGLVMLAKGTADAALVDVSVLRSARLDQRKFHILPLTVPEALKSTYTPIIMTQAEAPGLIAAGKDIETIAAPLAILVISNKPARSREKLAEFSGALFRNAANLRINSNIAADIPGWTRHSAAAQALKDLLSQVKSNTDTELQQGDGQ